MLVFGSFLLLCAAVPYLASRFSEPAAGHLTRVAERKTMPALAFTRTDGQTWSLQDHRGQVVLINLWATWCGPCQEETPGLVRLAAARSAKDLVMLGLSLDAGGATAANKTKVAAFVHRFHVPYPIAFPAAGSQMGFGVDAIPTTILVDRQGRVAKIYEGAVHQRVFEKDIDELLREPERAATVSAQSAQESR